MKLAEGIWVIVSIRSGWLMKVALRDICYSSGGFMHKNKSILLSSCLKCTKLELSKNRQFGQIA